MNLSCGARTIKYLIFTFNFFFVITGIVLVAVGASIVAVYSDYHLFLSGSYFSLPNLLIATGCLIFVISFLGCYGAMKQSWIMLAAFSVLLGIIFIFEFSAGIAGYVLRDKTASYLETTLTSNMKLYDNDSSVATLWDSIQNEFQCCGVFGYNDWVDMRNTKNLPISCCPPQSGTIGQFYCNAIFNGTTRVNPSTASTTETTLTPVPIPPLLSALDSNNSIKMAPVIEYHVNRNIRALATPNAADTTDTSSNATDPTTYLTTYPPTTTNPYETGCEAAFGDFVRAHAVDIGGIGFALAVLQLIGIGFSCYLSRQLKNSYYST